MKLENILKEFLRDVQVRGATDMTLRHYKTHIGYFISYTKNCDISKINYNTYENYILYLKNKYKESSGFKGKKEKLSSRTVKTYASDAKTFYSFCYKRGYLQEDISQKIKMPKYKKKTIVILSKQEIINIINLFDISTFTGARDILIISFMLDSGLRLSEVSKLSIANIDIYNRIIYIDGKGQKERIVPLSDTTFKYYNNYLKVYKNNFGTILIAYVLKTIDNIDISKNTIALIFKRIKKRLNLNKFNPHLLRHTFATYFLINGGDIVNLQMILGHSTLNMVLNYLHLAQQMQIATQSRFSPLSNLNGL